MLKERNLKIAVFSALLVSLFIAFIFNLTLSVGEGTVMPLSNGDWLNFWGSYAGSVLALVVGLIAIFYTNANCEWATASIRSWESTSRKILKRHISSRLRCVVSSVRSPLLFFGQHIAGTSASGIYRFSTDRSLQIRGGYP